MRKAEDRNRLILSVLVSTLLYFMVPPASAAWLSDWEKRIRLTIDHNDISNALCDFPLLVYLSTNSGINNADVSPIFDELGSDSNRTKIAVTTSNGTNQCYVEIDKWIHTNEQAWLWVKVPTVASNADTDLYIYYDNDRPDNTNYVGDPNSTPAENVWDSNFVMVQHLGEEGGTVYDSTTNNNDGTPYPLGPNFDITSCDDTNGWAGTSLSLDTNDMKEGSASLRHYVSSPVSGNTYTVTYNPAGSWDFGNRNLNFWFKSSRSNANFNSARVYVYDTNSPANWRRHDLTFNINIWTRFNVGISSGGTNSSTPPASNAIDRIEWQFEAADTIEFTNKIDIVYANGGPVITTGKIDGAQDFGGIDDYIAISSMAGLAASENRTVSLWVKMPAYNVNQFFVSLFREGEVALQMNSGSLRMFIRQASGYTILTWAVDWSVNTWHYVTFVVDVSGTINGTIMYADGTIKDQDTAYNEALKVTAFDNWIGANSWAGGANYLVGILDEVRIYNEAKSASWIKADYETQRDHLLDFGLKENRPAPPGTVFSVR